MNLEIMRMKTSERPRNGGLGLRVFAELGMDGEGSYRVLVWWELRGDTK